ncbi:GNAT family N-acetyltransferase [Bacteroides oleiciplenus]|uniref:GNAT family N-acetyltransferase n=1 Tax=Bacteroides oleiciplenus TaxID=626931 RepID=A0A3E5BQ27_9BACE|nr:GNAT family N-acetyltransferase [Bacteroides oleiciplenus]RGN39495.1 GNAT family N-acetyltransferase [Bacteroides oleiciplenus]
MGVSTATDQKWNLVRYSAEDKERWDRFVRRSKNGTFLLQRDYMDYHADRFQDCSLLIFCNQKLIALFPGNLSGDCFYSHQGLTYGGILLSPSITLQQTENVFRTALNYLQAECNVKSLVYRAIPHIYHRYPAEEDLYILTRLGATLTARSISSVIPLDDRLPFRTLRCRQLKKARACALKVIEDEDFISFWKILEENLHERYSVNPVHSLEEILRLHRNFPRQISLFRICNEAETLGGCVVYETDEVAHVQYIAASSRGKKCGALDLLFHQLIYDRYAQKRYFDFGISTEHGGQVLNEGLLFQKEGFGARAIMYDVYKLKL